MTCEIRKPESKKQLCPIAVSYLTHINSEQNFLTDTGLSWSQSASCFFAQQFTRARKKIHLFQTFD